MTAVDRYHLTDVAKRALREAARQGKLRLEKLREQQRLLDSVFSLWPTSSAPVDNPVIATEASGYEDTQPTPEQPGCELSDCDADRGGDDADRADAPGAHPPLLPSSDD